MPKNIWPNLRKVNKKSRFLKIAIMMKLKSLRKLRRSFGEKRKKMKKSKKR